MKSQIFFHPPIFLDQKKKAYYPSDQKVHLTLSIEMTIHHVI